MYSRIILFDFLHYRLQKVMERRQQKLTEVDINILKEIYSRSSVFRTWERIGNTELSV